MTWKLFPYSKLRLQRHSLSAREKPSLTQRYAAVEDAPLYWKNLAQFGKKQGYRDNKALTLHNVFDS